MLKNFFTAGHFEINRSAQAVELLVFSKRLTVNDTAVVELCLEPQRLHSQFLRISRLFQVEKFHRNPLNELDLSQCANFKICDLIF